MTESPKMFICRESFWTPVDGIPQSFVEGRTLVSDDSEIYRLHPEKFRLAVAQYRGAVEQATDAPGEKRTVKV